MPRLIKTAVVTPPTTITTFTGGGIRTTDISFSTSKLFLASFYAYSDIGFYAGTGSPPNSFASVANFISLREAQGRPTLSLLSSGAYISITSAQVLSDPVVVSKFGAGGSVFAFELYAPTYTYDGVTIQGYGYNSSITPVTATSVTSASSTDYKIGWNSWASSVSMLGVGSYFQFSHTLGTSDSKVGANLAAKEGVVPAWRIESSSFVARNKNDTYRIYRLDDGRILYVNHSSNAYQLDAAPPASGAELFIYGMLYQGYDELATSLFAVGGLSTDRLRQITAASQGTFSASATMAATSLLVARALPRANFDGTSSLLAVATAVVPLGGTSSFTGTLGREITSTMSGTSELYGELSWEGRGTITLSLFTVLGDDTDLGLGSVTLALYTLYGDDTPLSEKGVADLVLPYLTSSGNGSDHDVGSGAVSLPMFGLLGADYEYGLGESLLPLHRLNASGGFIPGDMLALFSDAFAQSTFTQSVDIVLVLTSQGTLASTYTMTREQALELISTITGSSTQSVVGVYAFSIISGLYGASIRSFTVGDEPDLQDTGVVWVVSMDTKASSQYEQYGFNSFFERAGVFYGVAGNGIYKLEGETDAGAAIKSLADLGKTNLGSKKLKSVPYVYLGVSSTDKMVLKVVADGVENYYTARDGSETLQNQRVDIGKGLKGNYWQLVVENNNGCDFSLEGIEFAPLKLSRSI